MILALELVTMDKVVEKWDLERWVMRNKDLAEPMEIVYERQGEDGCSKVFGRRKPARRAIGPATLVKGMEILGSKFF